jgi:hypothetical protein
MADAEMTPSTEGARMVEEIRAGNQERLKTLGAPGVQSEMDPATVYLANPDHIPYLDSD